MPGITTRRLKTHSTPAEDVVPRERTHGISHCDCHECGLFHPLQPPRDKRERELECHSLTGLLQKSSFFPQDLLPAAPLRHFASATQAARFFSLFLFSITLSLSLPLSIFLFRSKPSSPSPLNHSRSTASTRPTPDEGTLDESGFQAPR